MLIIYSMPIVFGGESRLFLKHGRVIWSFQRSTTFLKHNYLLFFARFIMIIMCIQYIYVPARKIIKHLNKELSVLKLVRYLMKNPGQILLLLQEILNFKNKIFSHLKSLAKYCSYESRTRQNYQSHFDSIFS